MKKEEIYNKLASKMLELASDKFSNHGCNDLDSDVLELIDDELLEEIRIWNDPTGEEEWPYVAISIGDSSLMHFLADKLVE